MFDWRIKPDALTPRFLDALKKWQAAESRSVQIKIESDIFDSKPEPGLSIWCFDYKVMEGKYVSKITEIPTTKQLLAMKQASIEKERAELQKKMDNLEGK
jgi:hypothetical protein